MTREEVIAILHNTEYELSNQVGSTYCRKKYDAVRFAIKALEQETVSKESYDHEYFLRKEFELKIDKLQRQLGNIRVEIEQLRLHKAQFLTNDNKVCIDSQAVIDIIDKHKAESEG